MIGTGHAATSRKLLSAHHALLAGGGTLQDLTQILVFVGPPAGCHSSASRTSLRSQNLNINKLRAMTVNAGREAFRKNKNHDRLEVSVWLHGSWAFHQIGPPPDGGGKLCRYGDRSQTNILQPGFIATTTTGE